MAPRTDYQKQWRIDNPDKYKAQQLVHNTKRRYKKFGLTKEEYDEMFLNQNNCCAICGSSTNTSSKDWSIDHCHATGKVRGVLCHSCNLILGHAKDNTAVLEKAVKYLNEHSPSSVRLPLTPRP